MGFGPFSSESTAKIDYTSATDNAQVNKRSPVIQGQGQGQAGGKNNKFVAQGAVSDSQTGGINLDKFRGRIKGDLIVNYTEPGSPVVAPAIPPTPYVPPSASNPPPEPGNAKQPESSIIDKLTDLIEPKDKDGNRQLNKGLVFAFIGSIIAIGFGIKLIRK